MNFLALLFRTIAIVAGIWTILMLLFCIAWAGLIRMARNADRNLFDDGGEIERASGAQTVPPPVQNVIEWQFPNPTPEDLERQAARK